jgi:hypothetical protein
MPQVGDLSRSFVAFEQTISLTVAVEMSGSSWLLAGMVSAKQLFDAEGADPCRERDACPD